MPTLRLEEPTLGSLTLDPEAGYVVQSHDLGDASPRAVVSPTPDADGTINRTRYGGDRAVQISVHLVPVNGEALWTMEQRLRAYTRLDLRPWLYVTEDDGVPELRLQLVPNGFTAPRERLDYSAVMTQWRADRVESVEERTVVVAASGAGSTAGFKAPLVFPLNLTALATQGTGRVVNAGTAIALPLLRLYGPCTNPKIENQTTGEKMEFTANGGLTLLAGEFVEIDTRAKTARLNGDPTQSRHDRLAFAISRWIRVLPGMNEWRYYPTTYSPPAEAHIITHDVWA